MTAWTPLVRRLTFRVVSPGYDFGWTYQLTGAAANEVLLSEDPDQCRNTPHGRELTKPWVRVNLTDSGFVVSPGRGEMRLCARLCDEAAVLKDGDTLQIGRTVYLARIDRVPDAIGCPRQVPEEESLGSVYEGLKELFRRMGLLRGYSRRDA